MLRRSLEKEEDGEGEVGKIGVLADAEMKARWREKGSSGIIVSDLISRVGVGIWRGFDLIREEVEREKKQMERSGSPIL